MNKKQKLIKQIKKYNLWAKGHNEFEYSTDLDKFIDCFFDGGIQLIKDIDGYYYCNYNDESYPNNDDLYYLGQRKNCPIILNVDDFTFDIPANIWSYYCKSIKKWND